MNFNNDADIAARTLKQGTVLRFPGEHFPGGQDLSCDFQDEVRAPQLQQWCNMVRAENERQAEQVARQRSEEAARAVASVGPDPDAGERGGSTVPAPEASSALEEELQVRKERLQEELRDVENELSILQTRFIDLSIDLEKVDASIVAVQEIVENAKARKS